MVIVLILARAACAVTAFGAAGYMASNGIGGWGWFLFVGLCLGWMSVSYE